jgi:hypothetical protein
VVYPVAIVRLVLSCSSFTPNSKVIFIFLGVKFDDSRGRERALFIYKSIHRCNHLSPKGQVWLYDSISNTDKYEVTPCNNVFILKKMTDVLFYIVERGNDLEIVDL